MDKENKHRRLNFKDFIKYFGNNLPKKERHAFEKRMMQDLFDEEAFEGLSKLKPDEINKDINELSKIINQKTKKEKTIFILNPVFRYAAVAIILLGFAGIFLYLSNKLHKQDGLVAEKKLEKPGKITDSSISEELGDTLIVSAITPEIKSEEQKETEKAKSDNKYKKILKKAEFISEDIDLEYETEMPVIAKEQDTVELAEIAIVGYGSEKKSAVTGAATFVKEAIEEEQPETEIEIEVNQTLQKQAGGVAVSKEGMNKKGRMSILANEKREAEEPGLDEILNQQTAPYEDLTYEKIEEINEILVTGKVTDASNNEPLPGVNVVIEGSTKGTVTDTDGYFSIKIPAKEGNDLQFEYIGYESVNIQFSNDTNISLALEQSLYALDEIVVVGYGSQKTSDYGGAISTIDFDDNISAPNIIPPKPVCGKNDYKKYIKENIQHEKLPDFDKDLTVKLSFIINTNGEITDIEVIKSQGEDFDNEAIRLLRKGPAWEPATQDDIPVAKKVRLNVKFEKQ